jgi:drug/metabolite transporter (DMT)-like permease
LLIGEILPERGVLGIILVMIGLFVISGKNFHLSHLVPQSGCFTSRPYILALTAALASSIYSVIDKIGVQMLPPAFYLWLSNLWTALFTGLYLVLRREVHFLKIWKESKKEILIIAILQNIAYLLVLMALQMSKVSYVVAFRQVGTLLGAGMGIFFLKESCGRTRITRALILVLGLVLIGLAK